MEDVFMILKIFITGLGVIIGQLVGEWNGFLYVLMVFIIMDYITGLMAAILSKKLSSSIGFRGIFKKIVILFLVVLGHIIDLYIIQQGDVIRLTIIFFYSSNEGVSILENCAKIGIPIPKKLKDVLEQLNNEN